MNTTPDQLQFIITVFAAATLLTVISLSPYAIAWYKQRKANTGPIKPEHKKEFNL